jgi:hypothetical protein
MAPVTAINDSECRALVCQDGRLTQHVRQSVANARIAGIAVDVGKRDAVPLLPFLT